MSRNRKSEMYLGMVTHFVLQFCVVIAFSSSSSWPVFFSFFTKLFTAFSHHFSSCPFCSPLPATPGPLGDFFQPRSLFTTGGVNGKMDDILTCQAGSFQLTQYRLNESGADESQSWNLGLLLSGTRLITSEAQSGSQNQHRVFQRSKHLERKITRAAHNQNIRT